MTAHLVLGIYSLLASTSTEARASACTNLPGPHLEVAIHEHRLSLCEGEREIKSFSVRLGWDGAGKTKAGDRKVPTGTYPLGKPRPSKQYGTFIPIGYPTPSQAARGYTGGSVGVHGPGRRVRWLGRLVNLIDTTDGCVGIATDDEMKEIASWVSKHHPASIRIH